nr:cytochrome c biogenesis protein ResB [Bacteroidaceae bacterium]
LIDDEYQGGTLQGWKVEVLEVLDEAQPIMTADSTYYEEWHQSGALTALYVKATTVDGARSVEGWITSGSYMFPYQLLKVTQHQYIIMAEREPQRYRSQVEILTKSGKRIETEILVNQPYSLSGWKIYQLSYDSTRGKWSEISVLELVHDPWLPYVYFGIYLMLAGAVIMLFTAQRKKE